MKAQGLVHTETEAVGARASTTTCRTGDPATRRPADKTTSWFAEDEATAMIGWLNQPWVTRSGSPYVIGIARCALAAGFVTRHLATCDRAQLGRNRHRAGLLRPSCRWGDHGRAEWPDG